ncbi:uncharacterized protein LOC117182612 [Belonocnema kinseyi]|uniref:uncharacterized protein LOC117182612 n=1 Tax=Belonocnema kinseyi TaxID=2817044 RepID=UPI00143D5988|nr:uncharacterized protein LOC117182612 [Belonocnema kinseyi]
MGKLYSLAYADDVVLLADDVRGMNLLMRVFEEYVREKGLTINVNKTKMMYFRNKRGRLKYEWKIKGVVVELVDEFCYLGFWFETRGGSELQEPDVSDHPNVKHPNHPEMGSRSSRVNLKESRFLFLEHVFQHQKQYFTLAEYTIKRPH